MPTFRFNAETITLGPGERWDAPHHGDTYRDAAAETLRGIVAEIRNGSPWRGVVGQRFATTQPWLHAIVTSPARDRFFREHPPGPQAAILDVGSGWGQIALPLARAGRQVTALEPTPERLDFIQAVAEQEQLLDRISFIQAGFHEIDFTSRFDLVSCIGVLEWVPKFQPGDPRSVQLDFLRRIRATLAPAGKCYLGIENRLGLKYLLGARDDHTGQRGISVLDAALASAKHRAATGEELRAFTYTLAEYADLFAAAGFGPAGGFAAFPDYKLPELILPVSPPEAFNEALLRNPLPPEHDGCDGQVLPAQEELTSHYRSLARMGLAHCFSPSFFFVLQ